MIECNLFPRRSILLILICLSLLAGCVNQRLGVFEKRQRECVASMIGRESVSAEIDYFFEYAYISFDKCPLKSWNFRFSNRDIGQIYFEKIKSYKADEKIKIKAIVNIESIDGKLIVISRIDLQKFENFGHFH